MGFADISEGARLGAMLVYVGMVSKVASCRCHVDFVNMLFYAIGQRTEVL